MTVVTWTGFDGNWATDDNWSTGAEPGTGDDVIIDDGSPDITGPVGTVNTVTVGGVGTLLEIDAGSLITVGAFTTSEGLYIDGFAGQGGSSLTVDGTLTNSGGVIHLGNPSLSAPDSISAAGLSNTGLIILESNPTGSPQILATLKTTAGAGFTNSSELEVDPSANDGGSNVSVSGTLTNTITGVIYLGNAGLSASDEISAASLFNTGTIIIEGSAAGQAKLEITTGTAGFGTAGVLTGTVDLTGDSAVEFASGQISSVASGSNLILNGPNAFIEDANDVGANSALTALTTNDGGVLFLNRAFVVLSGDFTNFGGGSVYSGDFEVDDEDNSGGSDLSIGGALTNNGQMDLGNVDLSAPDEISAASFSNTADILIQGNGASDALLAVTGNLNNSGTLLVDYLAGGDGGSDISVGGTLTNASASSIYIGNTGNVSAPDEISAGSIVNTGKITIQNGPLSAPVNITVTTALDNNAAGTIVVEGVATLSGILNNADNITIENGGSLTTSGAINNSYVLEVDYAGSAGGSDLSVGGTLSNTGGGTIFLGYPTLSASAKISAPELSNTGSIDLYGSAAGQALLDVTAGTAGFGMPGLLTGSVSLTGNSVIEFADGQISSIASGSDMFIDGATAFIEDATDPDSNSALTGLAGNAGLVTIENGASVAPSGNFTNSDYLAVESGGDLSVAGALTNTNASGGELEVVNSGGSPSAEINAATLSNPGRILILGNSASATASLTVTGTATSSGFVEVESFGNLAASNVDVTAGTLEGSGTVTGVLNNDGGGTVTGVLNGVPDILTVSGTYNQSGTGVLQVGINPGDAQQSSIVTVIGNVNLAGGTLLVDAYATLTLNTPYTVMTFAHGELTGQFSQVQTALFLGSYTGNGTGVTVGNGDTLEVLYDNASGTVQVELVSTPQSGPLSITAPSAATVGVGQPGPISGVTIVESPTTSGETFTVALTDANGLLSATTSATGGGGAITEAGGTSLTITGTLTQVDADLTTLTDTDATTPSDTITVNASDSNGGKATPVPIAVTVNGLPVIAAPVAAAAQPNQATAISGVSLFETGNTTTSGETFVIMLADTNGLLSANTSASGGGGTITGGGTTSLTIAGTLTQVDADLTALTDTEPSTAPDAITVNASDSFRNIAAQQAIAVNPTLFTDGSDNVNFNDLTAVQVFAINAGAEIYDSLAGNDTVVLPDPANYQLTPTVGWDSSKTFYMGDGDDTLSGGDGNYIVSLGNGNDTVMLGNGDDNITVGSTGAGAGALGTVTVGSGTDTISIIGDGDYSIYTGGGTDTVTLNGNGDNEINASSGTAAIIILGNGANCINGPSANGQFATFSTININGSGENKVIGNVTANEVSLGALGNLDVAGVLNVTGEITGGGTVTIENGATLGVEDVDDTGVAINFAGAGGTLKINDPSAFSGPINALTIGDTIDFPNEPEASAQINGATLTVYFPGNQSVSYQVSGNLAGAFPYIQSDGSPGGTELIVDPSALVKVDLGISVAGVFTLINSFGSGVIIGPHTILTAAHVVLPTSQSNANTNANTIAITSNNGENIDVSLVPSSLISMTSANAPNIDFIGGSNGYIWFYQVNEISNGQGGMQLDQASQPYDLALIYTSQDLTVDGSVPVQIDPNYPGGQLDLEGYPGTPVSHFTGIDNRSLYGAESSVTVGNGILVYSQSTILPSPSATLTQTSMGMSGGPALVNNSGVLEDVGVFSQNTDAVQITAADCQTIQNWMTPHPTSVTSGETLIVSAEETYGGITVLAGGTLEVDSGGTANDIAVDSGGSEIVASGGTDTGATIESGGSQTILAGGTASGTVLDGSALQYVYGTASGTTVESGDVQIVESGGTASGTILESGGTIDVAYLPYVSGGSATLNSASDVLTVSEGGQTYTEQLSGDYTAYSFELSDGGAGGTDIQLAPLLAGGGNTVYWTQGNPAAVVDNALTVTYAGSATLSGATATISGGFLAGDVLSFTAPSGSGITGSYTAATGTLTLSGTASLAAYQAALDSVTYSSTSANPTNSGADPTRTVSWTATSGAATSATVTSTVNLTALPVLAGAGNSVSYTQGGVAVAVDSTLTANDFSSTTLSGATVAITGGLLTGDVLSFTAPAGSGISGSYTAATGTLTLSGTASLASYHGALDSVSYSSTSANPTNSGADPTRTVSWTATSGTASSTAVTSTVDISTTSVGPTAGNGQLYIGLSQTFDLTKALLNLDTPGRSGDTLEVTSVGTTGTRGTVTLKNGDLTYTAPGSGSSDAFTYTVTDEQLQKSATGNVSITLDPGLTANDTATLTGSGDIVDAGNGNDHLSLSGNNNTVALSGGNDTLSLSGNNGNVAVGAGNDNLSLMGNNATVTAGGGNDSLSLTGNNDTVTLGNGNDDVTVSGIGESITTGTGNDSFTLGGSMASLFLYGQHDTVSVNGGTDTITDTPKSTDALMLQMGALGGTVSVANFSVAQGVVLLAQALASAEGWTTSAQVAAALGTDGHGGSLLGLGTNGSIDFVAVPPNQLHASNFHVG